MIKKISTIIALLFLIPLISFGVEGMWMMQNIDSLNYRNMRHLGLKLSSDEIYSTSTPSLKDKVAIFGSGCTCSVISKSGLIITNHHCGYSSIQRLSTIEKNYLKDGFWANNGSDELPCKGLNVTFVRQIHDITSMVLDALPKTTSEKERERKINDIIDSLKAQVADTSACNNIIVKQFFGGNQFILFENEVYSDIRLVGTPPVSIGKFGGDTDNWMWPRHTGDFSLFRIYGTKDGKSAQFSEENVPLKTNNFFPISIKGIKKGDFVMLAGFPGSTNRYLTSFGIEKLHDIENKIRIEVRGARQEILMKRMKADTVVNLQYSSKYSISSNYWKNAIGMNEALDKLGVVESKREREAEFTEWVEISKERKATYGKSLKTIKTSTAKSLESTKLQTYINEAMIGGVELIGLASKIKPLAYSLSGTKKGKKLTKLRQEIEAFGDMFYKNYNVDLDREVSKKMVEIFVANIEKKDLPSALSRILTKHNNNISESVDYIFDNSLFSSEAKFDTFLEDVSTSKLVQDPAYAIADGLLTILRNINSQDNSSSLLSRATRFYNQGYKEMMSERGIKLYPDANFTLRLSYGNVMPYLDFHYKTYLSELIEKEDITNPYEFTVDTRLKELYKARDFGNYGRKDVVVSFIADLDITGGNSGSPVINNKGEVVGIAFDGNWEAMSGDLLFEPQLQRAISVDIRYILFIIDKFGNCQRIIDELDEASKKNF